MANVYQHPGGGGGMCVGATTAAVFGTIVSFSCMALEGEEEAERIRAAGLLCCLLFVSSHSVKGGRVAAPARRNRNRACRIGTHLWWRPLTAAVTTTMPLGNQWQRDSRHCPRHILRPNPIFGSPYSSRGSLQAVPPPAPPTRAPFTQTAPVRIARGDGTQPISLEVAATDCIARDVQAAGTPTRATTLKPNRPKAARV